MGDGALTAADWASRAPDERALGAVAEDSADLSAEEILLALLLHREAHDARFRAALLETEGRMICYIEGGRRRVFGVDARRRHGGNRYGRLLMALRDSRT